MMQTNPKKCGGYASLKAGDPPGGRLVCARCGVLEPKSARTVYAAEALKREAIDEMRDADVDLDTSPADDLAYVMNATHALVEECERDLSRRHELTRAARGLLKTVLAALLRRHRPDEGQFAFLVNAYVANDLDVVDGAGKESEIPNFKGSYLDRFPLVSADFWTSDHLSERSRSVDALLGTRARGTTMLKRR